MSSAICKFTKLMGVFTTEYGSNVLTTKRRCESKARLDGKVVVITGANTGIGKETTLQLSLRGAKIYIGCRSLDKAEAAVNEILNTNPSADITSLKLDLSSLKSVREFANQLIKREQIIDILINNAGVMLPQEVKTEDGFEMTFGTNYLGPFLLTMLLLPSMKRSKSARIINVSAILHSPGNIDLANVNKERTTDYSKLMAYCDSKLAQILFTRELAMRLDPHSNVNVYALHPGVVKTELSKNADVSQMHKNLFFLSTEMGCQTTLYCALEESLANESGHYYDNCKRVDKMVKSAVDDEMGSKLWRWSCESVGIDANRNV